MKETFATHPDFGVLAKQLKIEAQQGGHNPMFAQNGTGTSMTCRDCGSQTHIEQHHDEWHAMSSPAHRLHFNNCK